MECHCLRFRDIPHTSRLISTYLEDFSAIKEFYSHPPNEAGVRRAAREAKLAPGSRRALVAALRDQNCEYGADRTVERNLDRLASGAAAIVTGQQVGLFGGSSYSFYKALSAIHWAEKLSGKGTEAVPIFWLAAEDHDLKEVNQVVLGTPSGLVRLEASTTAEVTGQSVGRIAFDTTIGAVVDRAVQLLAETGRHAVGDALIGAYCSEENFGSGFAKLMTRLLAGRGLIFLDPLDARLHRLAAPIYLRALKDSRLLTEALLARNKVLSRRRFDAQVKVKRQGTLLFLETDGKRQPLRHIDSGFSVGDRYFREADLLSMIEANPESFTPSVLFRPVVQDYLLPTAAYVAGPAEIAYFAQAQVVYRHLLGRMPAILPRASFTLIEPEVQRLLKRYNLTIEDIFRGRQEVHRRMAQQSLPRGLVARFHRDESALRQMLKGLRAPLARLDQTLLGAVDTAERKMTYQFQKLRGKAGRAEGFRTGVLDRHEARIFNSLYPVRGLQERTLSLLPFIARQGPGLLNRLSSELKKDTFCHRVLFC